MINYERRRKIIIAAIAVVAVIFVFFIYVLIKNTVSDNNKPQVPDVSRTALLSTDSDNSIVMSARGELINEEDYDSYQITISPSVRSVIIMKGYNQDILKRYDYSNNKKAYEQFVYALDKLNITDSRNLSETENDTRGVCAKGSLKSYSIVSSGSIIKNVWTSSCRDSKGSLRSNSSDIESLVKNQLPAEALNVLPRL
jgi:hypothetical protein